MKKILFWVLLLVLGIGEMEAQEKGKKGHSFAKTRRQARRYEAAKKSQSASQNAQYADFRGSVPTFPQLKTNPTSNYRGQQPTAGSVDGANELKTSRFKGNQVPDGGTRSEVKDLKMSRFQGSQAPERGQGGSEAKGLKMSRFLGTNPVPAGHSGINPDQLAHFRGSEPVPVKQINEINQFRMSQYRGMSLRPDKSFVEVNQYRMSRYRGDLLVRDPGERDILQYRISRYRGDLRLDLANRQEERELLAFKNSRFKGEKIISHSVEKKQYKKMSREMKGFTGGPVRAKRKRDKTIPPTNPDKEAEIPGYDSREPEIWVRPRNPDGSAVALETKKKGFLGGFKNLFKKGPRIQKPRKDKGNTLRTAPQQADAIPEQQAKPEQKAVPESTPAQPKE